MTEITVHCMVRNEERFVQPAILSILPLAQRVLVYDTGSTDATLSIVSSLQNDKIEVVRKNISHSNDISEYRNEMIERTKTEWYMLVDGDEIYPAHAVQRIVDEMRAVPPTVHRINLDRWDFVGSFNFILPVRQIGRIFRTSQIGIRPGHPRRNRPWVEQLYLRGDPSAPLDQFTMPFPKDIFFFHCHYLVRSSRDADLGEFRRWREPRFPARLYFGPWPETLRPKGITRWMTPKLTWTWIWLNARILWARCFDLSWKPTGA
jgi:glycosyltransferase involved in cell wall biosynthesis